MHHRYDKANIPTEVLRTLVAVVEARNFSQAGNLLGLTQSAISAQIRRLEQVIGREVFQRSAMGMQLTDHGKVVLSYARRILAMNDQLLSHSNPNQTPHQIRIGLPKWMSERKLIEVIDRCSSVHSQGRLNFRCDTTEQLIRDLSTGQLDIALLCHASEYAGVVVHEWWEELFWVKSPELALDQRVPIPLVSWPGSQSDRVAAKAFAEADLQYEIAFTAPDTALRLGAVAAGLGVMIVDERHITREVQAAKESFLPALPQSRKAIYTRETLDLHGVERVVQELASCVRPLSSNVITVQIKKIVHDSRGARKARKR